MKRNRLFGKSFFLATLLMCGMVQVLWSSGNGENTQIDEGAASERISATVEYMEGYVLINGEAAKIGQEVPAVSQVKTGIQSFCTITFAEKNIFRIGPNTISRISIGPNANTIDISQGSIGAVFDRLKKVVKKGDFRITSPTASAGVRGTVFYIRVEKPTSTYLCTCHGTLHQHSFSEDPETGREVTAHHHEAYRYTYDGEEAKAEQAEMLYHEDEEMEAIAQLIDIDIPWGSSD